MRARFVPMVWTPRACRPGSRGTSRRHATPLTRASVWIRTANAGVIEAQIPKAEFEAVLAPSERSYSGFNSALLDSSEIVVRTPEQAALFNQYIVG